MNKYLVIYKNDNGELFEPVIETATEIFRTMDTADYSGISIKRIYLIHGFYISHCVFHGVWHDSKEPLKMMIKIMCPATKEQIKPLDIGYGTDH